MPIQCQNNVLIPDNKGSCKGVKNAQLKKIIVKNVMKKKAYELNVLKVIFQMKMKVVFIQQIVNYLIMENVSNEKMIMF